MDFNDIQKFERTTFYNRAIHIVILPTIIFVLIILSGCRDLITETSNELVIGTEVNYKYQIDVYQPYDGFVIEPGKTLTIKWQTSKDIDLVNIFLYRKHVQVFSIAIREKNSNEYAWFIPNWFRQSKHYRIKIHNLYNDKEIGFSDTFSIVVPPNGNPDRNDRP